LPRLTFEDTQPQRNIGDSYMVQYAQERYISSPDGCWFYHVMDLPEFGTVNHFGSWDLRGRFDDYVSYATLARKTLLDVGCASGFLTFEAEKRGATVMSFDVSGGDVVNIDPKTDVAAKRTEVVRMQNG
jgi:2-polyprenyl-3-methyl-5-hydroxy-6-metoxy-1,4-benzoquinol methylase